MTERCISVNDQKLTDWNLKNHQPRLILDKIYVHNLVKREVLFKLNSDRMITPTRLRTINTESTRNSVGVAPVFIGARC